MEDSPRCMSPVKKNPSGKPISSRQKLMIINHYKSLASEKPPLKYKPMTQKISDTLGIGLNRVRIIISEYKKTGTVRPPSRKRNKPGVCDKIADLDKCAIRRKVHEFWFDRQLPTVNKILDAVNDDPTIPNFKYTSLRTLLADLNFEFTKSNRTSILTERRDLVSRRRTYLKSIIKFREEGRHVYYLDETSLDATTVTSNPTRLIVLHIGSEDGFVPGGLLWFESRKNTADDVMNGETFRDWFEHVLPLLKQNAVIVMDNAPYHCVKSENIPAMTWKKPEIVQWLIQKGEEVDPTKMVKNDLMDIVDRIKPTNTDVVDETAKEHNKTVLRLPPYHYELNPMELVWSTVKHHVKAVNTTYKVTDILKLLHEAVDSVKAENWQSFIMHVKGEEKKLLEIEFISDELVDQLDTDSTNPNHAFDVKCEFSDEESD